MLYNILVYYIEKKEINRGKTHTYKIIGVVKRMLARHNAEVRDTPTLILSQHLKAVGKKASLTQLSLGWASLAR